jgi:hypothetical protein
MIPYDRAQRRYEGKEWARPGENYLTIALDRIEHLDRRVDEMRQQEKINAAYASQIREALGARQDEETLEAAKRVTRERNTAQLANRVQETLRAQYDPLAVATVRPIIPTVRVSPVADCRGCLRRAAVAGTSATCACPGQIEIPDTPEARRMVERARLLMEESRTGSDEVREELRERALSWLAEVEKQP